MSPSIVTSAASTAESDSERSVATAPSLLTGASNAIEAAAQSLLLDMGEVRFMASAGIGALLELRKLATGAGGKLVVFNLSDELLEVLKLTNLDRIFVIAKDEAKALKSVA